MLWPTTDRTCWKQCHASGVWSSAEGGAGDSVESVAGIESGDAAGLLPTLADASEPNREVEEAALSRYRVDGGLRRLALSET